MSDPRLLLIASYVVAAMLLLLVTAFSLNALGQWRATGQYQLGVQFEHMIWGVLAAAVSCLVVSKRVAARKKESEKEE